VNIESIRLASTHDSEEILKIYEPYITSTAITFETAVPSVNEFSQRIENISADYPYLVYLVNDKIVGYAYASKHKERDAYRYDVDVSVYILSEYHGSGVGQKLYTCLLEILKELGYYNAYAIITIPNEKSIKFHEKFGFKLVGMHYKTGYKLGKWYDVAWLEKFVNEHEEVPDRIKSISELSDESLKKILRNKIKTS